MSGKKNIRARLFLTKTESEDLLELVDELNEIDIDTMDQASRVENWCQILNSLIFGKVTDEGTAYPIASTGIEIHE